VKAAPLTVPQSPAFALKRTTRAAAAANAGVHKEQDQVDFSFLSVAKSRPSSL